MPSLSTVMWVVWALSLLTIPHLLWLRKRPNATLAWAWAILAVPFVGAGLYLLVGADRMQRRRLRRRFQAAGYRELSAGGKTQVEYVEQAVAEMPPDDQAMLQVISRVNSIAPSLAQQIELCIDGDAFYACLEKRLSSAEDHIHLQFFIWRDDALGKKFVDLLVKKAKEGVEVRILLDRLGSWGQPGSYFNKLREAGGQFAWFSSLNPARVWLLMNLRNHRKLQIIDNTYAFVGGMNLGEEYAGRDPALGSWRDVQVELTGPVVSLLQESFADDWFFATKERLTRASYYRTPSPGPGWLAQVVASGPDSSLDPMQKTIVALLQRAKKRAWMTTGYFVPSGLILTALEMAAARGVDVRLIVSRKTDHPPIVIVSRSYYEELLEFGVRIYEYSRGVNHAKVMMIDGEWSMIGSANLDNRSMRLNFELNMLVRCEKTTADLEAVLARDFERSREINRETFLRRGNAQKWREAILRPLAPVL